MNLDWTQLLNVNNLVFALVVSLAVHAVRLLLAKVPNLTSSKIYSELVVPALPIAVGALLALLPYPFVAPFNQGTAKVFLGIVCGLVSGWVYKSLRGFLQTDSNTLGIQNQG